MTVRITKSWRRKRSSQAKATTRKRIPKPGDAEYEDEAQIAVVAWAREHVDEYECLADLFAVPNSAMVKPKARTKFTAMGRLAGVTDLIMLEQRGGYAGFLLEMKREKGRLGRAGRLSKEQKEFIKRHLERGYFVRVAEGRDAGIAALQEYLALPAVLASADLDRAA